MMGNRRGGVKSIKLDPVTTINVDQAQSPDEFHLGYHEAMKSPNCELPDHVSHSA
jgi:hypothetical protein